MAAGLYTRNSLYPGSRHVIHRARYYDPSNGRFNQRDTFEGSNFDPQSLHKYTYASCDPINRVDPSGNVDFIQTMVAVLGVVYLAVMGFLAAHPVLAIAAVVAISIAVPQLEAIPPGEPGPFDEMGQFGRVVRSTSSQAFRNLVRYFKGGTRGVPVAAFLAGGDKELIEAAKWVTPRAGYFDIIVHGCEETPELFWVVHDGKWVEVSHRSLSTYMKSMGYESGPVRLISCWSGKGPDGAAKNLANKLGAEVIAPTDKVWIHPSGKLTVGPTDKANTGTWETFTPGPSS
jgi:RHS repeat-associated protein